MRQGRIQRKTVGTLMVALMVSVALAGPVQAAERENHCIAPDGTDLNELLGVTDAIVLPFCTEVPTGDWWLPIVRFNFGPDHDVVPEGYVPAAATPTEDFLSKLEAVTYVVDAGTRKERSYTFSADSLQLVGGNDGFDFLAWWVPMHPLPPGEHTIATYVTLSSDHWDGLGLDASRNRIPAGQSSSGSRTFVVTTGD